MNFFPKMKGQVIIGVKILCTQNSELVYFSFTMQSKVWAAHRPDSKMGGKMIGLEKLVYNLLNLTAFLSPSIVNSF